MSPQILESLTPREREILNLVAQGLSLPEIAEQLHRSLKTIESHRLSLGRKLGASNRVELTRIAIAAGLAPLQPPTHEDPAPPAAASLNATQRADLEGRARALQRFQEINEEVFSSTGPTFLRRLVLAFSRVLNVRMAMVCVLREEDGKQTMHTVSHCDQGQIIDPISYVLTSTPCANVIQDGQACYKQGVAQRFPQDLYLKHVGAQSYAGIRLDDEQGRPLGLLNLISDQPMADGPDIELVLGMYAPRAAAELVQLVKTDHVRERTEVLEHEAQQRTAELTRASHILHSLVARSADGIMTVAPDTTVTMANPGVSEMIGYRADAIIGKRLCDLIHPDDLDCFQQSRYAATQKRVYSFELRLRRADGSTCPVKITYHAQFDTHNEYLGCLLLVVCV